MKGLILSAFLFVIALSPAVSLANADVTESDFAIEVIDSHDFECSVVASSEITSVEVAFYDYQCSVGTYEPIITELQSANLHPLKLAQSHSQKLNTYHYSFIRLPLLYESYDSTENKI